MKYLAAAESSLAQANRFYLLMYTIAAVIALTAYLEKGSILNDRKQAAENEITFVGLKKLAEPVYSNLRWNLTQLYPDKNVANRFQALLDDTEEGKRQIRNVWTSMEEPIAGENFENRIQLNKYFNDITALLHFNLPQSAGLYTPIADQRALLLAEVEPGSFEQSSSIDELKVDDATRYHWLSTLNINRLNSTLAEVEPFVASRDDFNNAVVAFQSYFETVVQRTTQRQNTINLANKWSLELNGETSTAESKLNYLRLRELTLAKIDGGIEASIEKRFRADVRATGTVTNVSLPFLDIPLRLADAVKYAPAVMAFCLLCIWIYQKRAIQNVQRWAGKANPESDGDVVGNTPLFLLSYGALSPSNVNTNMQFSFGYLFAWLISTILIALPTLIIWLARQYFSDSLSVSEDVFWPPSPFYIGLYACAFFLTLNIVKSFSLLGLMSEGTVSRVPGA